MIAQFKLRRKQTQVNRKIDRKLDRTKKTKNWKPASDYKWKQLTIENKVHSVLHYHKKQLSNSWNADCDEDIMCSVVVVVVVVVIDGVHL